MLALASVRPGERAVDLGSGDGRVVIALARTGLEAHGYEINPFLALWSLMMIRIAGVSDKAHIHWKSYWDADLSQFNVVIVFGMFHIMDELREKLEKELHPGSRVVANFFEFPVWRATAQDGRTYLYTLPEKNI
jgi:cyclopropane fatty-acyl-phospholipid synthase-like methyltransferase